MSLIVLNSQNIGSGVLPAAEGVIASISQTLGGAHAQRLRIRGHLLVTGNAGAGTITLRLRQGSLTGAQIYTTGALTAAAAATLAIPFEYEDGSDWIYANSLWVLTAIGSAGAGTFNGGYMALELVP